MIARIAPFTVVPGGRRAEKRTPKPKAAPPPSLTNSQMKLLHLAARLIHEKPHEIDRIVREIDLVLTGSRGDQSS